MKERVLNAFRFMRGILSPELILLLFIGGCFLLVALAYWTSGRDINQAVTSCNKTIRGAKEAYQTDHAETVKYFKIFQKRMTDLEEEHNKLVKNRTMERYKLTDEEFWTQVSIRDKKIKKCKEEGHIDIPNRQGWGVICVRKEAIVWQD